jgi:ribosomal protein L12E/L44/L45/RPP1/RPP2
MLKRYIESLQLKSATAQKEEDLDSLIKLAGKMNEATWTTIESQFTDPQDLEWVQLEIIAGRLEEQDLLPLLSNGHKAADTPDDDADPAPAKRSGRKAPAAKKAAKKTAPARRATR